MATKSKLETVFTGDDRPFNRVASRMRGTAKKLQGAFRGMGGAIAALGGGMAIRGTLSHGDRIGKLATRWQVGVETLQRLGHVANIGGSDLETVAKAMGTLNKNANKAANEGLTTYERQFEALGLNSKEFFRLNEEERWFAISDAIAGASNRARAMAAAQELMGRGGIELFAIMEQGSTKQREIMDEINPATEQVIRNLEKLNDTLTTLKTGAFSHIADIISGLVNAFTWVARRMGRELAVIQASFADIIKAAPALFPESMEEWAKTMKSAIRARDDVDEWIKMKEAEDAEKLKPKKRGGAGFDPEISELSTAKMATVAAAISKNQRNIFDPTRGGGFFAQATGRGIPLSKHATKSLDQKMKDLAQKTFQENQTTNQLLRDALL